MWLWGFNACGAIRCEPVQVFEARVGQAVPDGTGVNSHDVSCGLIRASRAECVRLGLTYLGCVTRLQLLAKSLRHCVLPVVPVMAAASSIARFCLPGVVAVLLAGCSSSGSVSVALPSMDQFVGLAGSPAIKYEPRPEPGSEPLAETISAYLDAAVRTVETRQYAAFPRPVTVYVPGSIASFASFCRSDVPVACVIGGHLFMSPKLAQQPQRIRAILLHELSHLQLEQIAGVWAYQTQMPSWFTEGLAVFVSDGGGAGKVSREAAAQAIRGGDSFVPGGSGSLLFAKHADDFGLTAHMFYRQAGMLVEWLYGVNPAQFEALLRQLWAGDTLQQAMLDSYGFGVAEAWRRFNAEVIKQPS